MEIFVYQICCLCVLTMMISRLNVYYLWQIPLAPGCAKSMPTEHSPCSHHLALWERLLHVLLFFLSSSWSWWYWIFSCLHWAWSWLCTCGTGLGCYQKMAFDWSCFMIRCSYPSKQGPLSYFQEPGDPIKEPKMGGPWLDWHWEEVWVVQTHPE